MVESGKKTENAKQNGVKAESKCYRYVFGGGGGVAIIFGPI
jgi:hypothetical protein